MRFTALALPTSVLKYSDMFDSKMRYSFYWHGSLSYREVKCIFVSNQKTLTKFCILVQFVTLKITRKCVTTVKYQSPDSHVCQKILVLSQIMDLSVFDK